MDLFGEERGIYECGVFNGFVFVVEVDIHRRRGVCLDTWVKKGSLRILLMSTLALFRTVRLSVLL